MGKEFGDIGFITFVLAGLAYFVLAVYLIINKKNRRESLWLTTAISVSALWSLATGVSFLGIASIGIFLPFLETLRGATWVVLFSLLLARIWKMQENEKLGKKLLLYLSTFLIITLTLSFLNTGYLKSYFDYTPSAEFQIYNALTLCAIIFLLIENLYRNSANEQRGGIKLLLCAVGALYIYDFLLYADILLFTVIGGKLFEARGMVNLLVVPFFAIAVSRNPSWNLNVKVSRKVVFHTITLIGTGAYLFGMAMAGYFLQNYGGKWGNILQITFILFALIGLVIFIFSRKSRALTKVLLSKHFFQHRYDYREEWLKFINTISSTGEQYDLRERVIKTLADVMNSYGGALWLSEQSNVYQLTTKWNFHYDTKDMISSDDEFIKFLEQKEWIVDLNNEIVDGKIKRHDLPVPEWLLSNSKYWLVLPLNHLGKLVGFVVLLQPHVKNNLNWESTDLLKTIGRQLASYLAEQNAEMALAESREFESFNRKFAFVVHDIKNLASQLSLIVRNAEIHADNPEFQKDMLLTVRDSVAKMNNLLSRITVVQEPSKERTDESLNINKIMEKIVKDYSNRGLYITFNKQEADIEIYADQESVETIFMHLIENAREACEEKNIDLKLELSRKDEFAIIKVIDNGHGMEHNFIQNELFRPFRSTKKNGYGIGAYESREMIKRLGGKLDVISKKGVGTTMTVYMRLAESHYVN